MFGEDYIANIVRKVLTSRMACCCNNIYGLTTLSPPVDAPGANGPFVLLNQATGEEWYWNGSTWVIGNAVGIMGETALDPPVDAPAGDDPTVLINLAAGKIWGWDGDSWERLNDGGTDTNWANTNLIFSASRTHDANNFFLTIENLAGLAYYAAVGFLEHSFSMVPGSPLQLRSANALNSAILELDPDNGTNLDNTLGIYRLMTPPPTDAGESDFIIGYDNALQQFFLYPLPGQLISDIAYAASWNNVTTIAPSKNAVYDEMELRAKLTDLDNLKKDQIGIRIDGSGAVISTGYKGRHRIPYSGTITGWTIIESSETPITSSIVVDVKLGTYANYDTTPTFASIAGTEKPTITNSERGQDLTLSTWTTAVIEGDFLEFTVDSVTDAESIMLFIHITKD